MAQVLVTLNDLEGHSARSFPVCRPFQVQSVEHLCSILLDFNWQRYMTNCPQIGMFKVTWLLNFGQITVICQKRYKIETYFQWKTNRKSYVAYRMAPVLVTLSDLKGHSPVAVLFECNRLCSILPDFNWQRARAVFQQQLGFLYTILYSDYLQNFVQFFVDSYIKTNIIWFCTILMSPYFAGYCTILQSQTYQLND